MFTCVEVYSSHGCVYSECSVCLVHSVLRCLTADVEHAWDVVRRMLAETLYMYMCDVCMHTCVNVYGLAPATVE